MTLPAPTTEVETPDLPTQVHQIGVRIEALKREYASNFLQIGALLSLVHNERLWKEAGASTFAEYLTDRGFSRAWGYSAIQVWERFGERALGVIPDRLRALVLLQLQPEQESQILEQARELPAGAFRDALRNLRGEKASDEEGCEHEWETRCSRCGRRG